MNHGNFFCAATCAPNFSNGPNAPTHAENPTSFVSHDLVVPSQDQNRLNTVEEENQKLKAELESLKSLLYNVTLNKSDSNNSTNSTPPSKKSKSKSLTPQSLKKKTNSSNHNLEAIELDHISRKLLSTCYNLARCLMNRENATALVPDPPSVLNEGRSKATSGHASTALHDQAKNTQRQSLKRLYLQQQGVHISFIEPFDDKDTNSDDEITVVNNTPVASPKSPFWRSQRATEFIDWIEAKRRSQLISTTTLNKKMTYGVKATLRPRHRLNPPIRNAMRLYQLVVQKIGTDRNSWPPSPLLTGKNLKCDLQYSAQLGTLTTSFPKLKKTSTSIPTSHTLTPSMVIPLNRMNFCALF
ncbi:hypothetical protein KEM48_000396 [Puccinia striiformis f. sp. tritici PST-130]|nr:hypothetical protein KEM48_000396 [Puccinia striiformis f. sp. tritici PST-130]